MTTKFKKWVVSLLGVAAMAGLASIAFVAGLLSGHRSEQMLMSSADAASALTALRQIEDNEIGAAKKTLFFMLERKMLTHWDSSKVGVVDFPKGAVPVDVALIERAMRGREALLSDPDIREFRVAESRENRYFTQIEARFGEMEQRYRRAE